MREIIYREAARFDLNALFVACVILNESAGDPKRWKAEPKFYKKYIEGKSRERLGGTWLPERICDEETERIGRAISWGAMQTMGQTARECGFDGNLTELLEPQHGIYFGCAYLKKCMNKAGQGEEQALLYFNEGLGTQTKASGREDLDYYPARVFQYRHNGQAARLLG